MIVYRDASHVIDECLYTWVLLCLHASSQYTRLGFANSNIVVTSVPDTVFLFRAETQPSSYISPVIAMYQLGNRPTAAPLLCSPEANQLSSVDG